MTTETKTIYIKLYDQHTVCEIVHCEFNTTLLFTKREWSILGFRTRQQKHDYQVRYRTLQPILSMYIIEYWHKKDNALIWIGVLCPVVKFVLFVQRKQNVHIYNMLQKSI